MLWGGTTGRLPTRKLVRAKAAPATQCKERFRAPAPVVRADAVSTALAAEVRSLEERLDEALSDARHADAAADAAQRVWCPPIAQIWHKPSQV